MTANGVDKRACFDEPQNALDKKHAPRKHQNLTRGMAIGASLTRLLKPRLASGMTSTGDLERDPEIAIDGAFARVREFLEALGFTIRVKPGISGFLRDVAIVAGELHVDRNDDDLAGELLHEAGHLAVLPGPFRNEADGDLAGVCENMSAWLDANLAEIYPDDPKVRAILQSGETEAVAWSYAAAVALGLDTRIPFYRGFDGAGLDLHDQVASGYYFGVHGLAAGGMSEIPRRWSTTPFPKMKRWLQI